MTDGIEVWAIDLDNASEAEALEAVNRTETERKFEDALAAKPAMLMSGLTIIGRQASTESGYPDLLGFDSDGRLVIFELKRGTLTRKAIAQVLDYGSDLESRTETDLVQYIVECSNKYGIEKIEDFSTWYYERFNVQEINIKPVRMAVVGLGVDAKAQRIVEFLQDREIDIQLILFHGFRHEGRTFMVKQAGNLAIPDKSSNSKVRRFSMSADEHRDRLLDVAREYNVEHWEDAIRVLRQDAKFIRSTQYGITFANPRIKFLPDTPARGSHSVVMDENNSGTIKITFYPASIDLLWDEFHEIGNDIPFQFEDPGNAHPTAKVRQQWYCVLNAPEWQLHKEKLRMLVEALQRRWEEVRREQQSQSS